MKKYNLYVSLIAVLMTACTFSGTKKDDQIDPNIKMQIHALNSKLIEGLNENNPDKVFPICSDKLLEKKGDLNNLMQLVKGRLKINNFEILNEFYQKNAAANINTQVMTGKTNSHDYIIGYEALNKEIYVSVGYFKDDLYEKSITFIYGKYGNNWKLNIINVGVLKIEKKDAFDWYQNAKSNYNKGYLIDAICNIGIASQLLKPANQLWQYQKENEIVEFAQKLNTQAYGKYTFPLIIGHVNTKPQIFRIIPQGMAEGYFPMILYTTSINLSDTTSLSKECDEIHSRIGELFNGITMNNKMIIYRAYKSIPNGNEQVEQYGFIRKN